MMCFRNLGPTENPADVLTLDARVDDLDRVLAFVDERLEALDCPMKVQMQLDVAVEELYVNVASYAYGDAVGPVTIQFRSFTEPLRVAITLIDQGLPYNPLEKPDPDVTLSSDARPIGGLGIYIVKKSMDDVLYDHIDGSNILTIVKNL